MPTQTCQASSRSCRGERCLLLCRLAMIEVERPLTSSTKRHISSPQNNAKLDTPFPMWQFGLHNRCFWRTRRSKIKTIVRAVDTPPATRRNTRRVQAKKARLISPRACAEKRRKTPKNAEKRRKTPKSAEKRRKPCA